MKQKVRIAATGHTLSIIDIGRTNDFIATFRVKGGIRTRVMKYMDRHDMKADAISQEMFHWLKRNHRRK